jgi:hypothetical protein
MLSEEGFVLYRTTMSVCFLAVPEAAVGNLDFIFWTFFFILER